MGARILVVEDNADNLRLMELLLSGLGHEPILCASGRQGVEAAARELPDLILMDLQMPEMDGFEAAALIRADDASAAIPMVALTAYAMVGDRETTLAAGFDGYIRKPFSPPAFAELIDPHLPADKRSALLKQRSG
jgi:two-component system cell cycle response regulator